MSRDGYILPMRTTKMHFHGRKFSILATLLTSALLQSLGHASCMWGVVQPGAQILGRLGGWEIKPTPRVGSSWDIFPTVTTFPAAGGGNARGMASIDLNTSETGQGIFFGTVGNEVTIQRVGAAGRTFGRLNAGLKTEHGARRGSAWVRNGRWESYPAMADQAPYTKKGASGGHVPNDALARNPQALPPIVVNEALPVQQPTPETRFVFMGTPRQVAKIDPKTGETMKDANGNIIYEIAKNENGEIIYDNDRWETVTINPPRTAPAPRAGSTATAQLPTSAFSFEAFPSYILVQNEVITRVYPAFVSATAQGAKPIRMFGGAQGALWSTDGKPLISDVQYTGGDTTVEWKAKGWWQGEIRPITGPVGTAPSAGGTSHNVITLIDAAKAMPIVFNGQDVLADFYLPSGLMALNEANSAGNQVTLRWNTVYRDPFAQATPAPVVAQGQPVPSPADNVIFYYNRSVNPAHKYKVVSNPGAGSSISPNYSAVLGAISKAGQSAVEARLNDFPGQDKHSFGRTWTTEVYDGKYNGHHNFYQTHWQKRYDWFEGGTIVAINAATGEILQSLPASDWNKVTDVAGRVQVAGNWVNVVGYAGVNTGAAESNVKTGNGWRRVAHPLTISFGEGPDFLAGPDNWRLSTNGRKPVFSAMRAIDFDGTGVKMWEWLGPTEGLLIWNPSGNKLLQPTGKEFFGFDTWGKEWEDGSAAFKTLDKNSSGTVEGDELKSVWVWLDANSDAKVQEGELTPLTEKGIDTVAIPSSKDTDDKGGVVVIGGARGTKGEFDIRDWWSVGGIGPKVYSQTVAALRAQPSIYEWKPTEGGGETEGGMLRYMTPSEGRIIALSVSLKDAEKAAKENGAVLGLGFAVNPGVEGGFGSAVNFGDSYLVSQWDFEDGNARRLRGESVTVTKDGELISDDSTMSWTAKHVSGPTLEDVADIARISTGAEE
jgi:hypothetical protein